jgi:PAS domain S-box-containing protein
VKKFSEQILALAGAVAHVGHWSLNLQTQAMFWSPECFRIFGRDPDIWVPTGDNYRDDMPNEDRKSLGDIMKRALEDRRPFQLEYRYYRGGRPEDVRWISAHCDFLDDLDGTNYLVGIAQDITDSKELLARLRETTWQLSKAQEMSKVGHWHLDAATKDVTGSDELFRIFGIGRDEATLDTFVEVVHPEDREYDVAHIQRGLEFGESWDIEHRLLCRDRRLKYVRAAGEATLNERGEVEGLFGMIQDITENVETMDALRGSRENFRSIIEGSPDSIVLKNLDREFVIANQNFLDRYGLAEEQVIGHTAFDIHPESFATHHEARERAVIESGAIERDTISVTLPDGTEHDLSLTRFPIFDSDGGVTGVGSISVDVTDQRRAEDALRQSQKMEAVGQLTGGVAHDFNNLLSVILGNAEVLEDHIGDDDVMRKRIAALKGAVDRAAALTERLLAFSRQQKLSPSATDVTDLIGGLEDMLRRTLGETIELTFDRAANPWPVTVDANQFENALVNLAINARHAMPDGGTLAVETSNVTLVDSDLTDEDDVIPGDYVLVAVRDTGTGMAPEIAEKAFDPFFTTKDVGEGSGLGLSMVYGFVKQSEGRIIIDSKVDSGTVVSLYLPRSRDSVHEEEAPEHFPAPMSGSESVLVIEDDESVRELVTTVLVDGGYQVVEAADGEQAIRCLKENPQIALLFTDVVLPGGLSGVEVAEEAKRDRPGIKVLYTTGYADNEDIEKMRLEPGSALLRKPYRRAELLEKIRTFLDTRG